MANQFDVLLSAAETDVARGAWRRVRRPGVAYVDAGRLPNGMVELISTNGAALDAVSAALCAPGTPVRRTQLPHPTRRNLAEVFDRAGELPPRVEMGALGAATGDDGGGTKLIIGIVGGGLALLIGIKVVKGLLGK
jgi:hypothetical protein